MNKKAKRMNKKAKREPSLLRKVIEVYWERGQERKAERNLAKLTWSLDFLAEALAKASRMSDEGLTMQIKSRDGAVITVYAKGGQLVKELPGESILDHLDDDLAVNDFIRRNSVR